VRRRIHPLATRADPADNRRNQRGGSLIRKKNASPGRCWFTGSGWALSYDEVAGGRMEDVTLPPMT
jgi:hypothetical protein